jgi:hypothetical protein
MEVSPEEYEEAFKLYIEKELPGANIEELKRVIESAPALKALIDKGVMKYVAEVRKKKKETEEKAIAESPVAQKLISEIKERMEKIAKIRAEYETIPVLEEEIRHRELELHNMFPYTFPLRRPVSVERVKRVRRPHGISNWRAYLTVFRELMEKKHNPTDLEWAKATWEKYKHKEIIDGKEVTISIGGVEPNTGQLLNCIRGKECGATNPLRMAVEEGVITIVTPPGVRPRRWGLGEGFTVIDLDKYLMEKDKPEELEEPVEVR